MGQDISGSSSAGKAYERPSGLGNIGEQTATGGKSAYVYPPALAYDTKMDLIRRRQTLSTQREVLDHKIALLGDLISLFEN